MNTRLQFEVLCYSSINLMGEFIWCLIKKNASLENTGLFKTSVLPSYPERVHVQTRALFVHQRGRESSKRNRVRREGAWACGFLNEQRKAETVLPLVISSQLRGRGGNLHIDCVGCLLFVNSHVGRDGKTKLLYSTKRRH